MRRVLGVVFLLSMFAVSLFGQSAAVALSKQEGKEVKAGDVITFNVKLQPPPNFPGGSIALYIGSVDKSATACKSTWNSMSVGNAQHEVTVPIHIPVDAVAGTWRVEAISFRYQNGNWQELGLRDHPTFTVVKTEVVAPKSADVEIQ